MYKKKSDGRNERAVIIIRTIQYPKRAYYFVPATEALCLSLLHSLQAKSGKTMVQNRKIRNRVPADIYSTRKKLKSHSPNPIRRAFTIRNPKRKAATTKVATLSRII